MNGQSCTNFLPDNAPGGLVCVTCRVDIREHTSNGGEKPLATMALDMYRLLTHYGHHCTVQNLLPGLRAALVEAGVMIAPGA